MQWAYEQQLNDVYVIYIDTGWADENWFERVDASKRLAQRYHFNFIRLQSKPDFSHLIQDRKDFPSTKFQWCAGFLKGLPLIDWLDEHDPNCEAIILLGKRRADSRANFDLPEYIEESEHYGDRKVWHALFDCDDERFDTLIHATRMVKLKHRSLECDPCVNSFGDDLKRVSKRSCQRLQRLEHQIGKNLFELPIEEMLKQLKDKTSKISSTEMFDMGCGAPYACGE